MKESRKTAYADPGHALASYLDDLLQTAVQNASMPEPEPAAPEPEVAVPELIMAVPELERAPAAPEKSPTIAEVQAPEVLVPEALRAPLIRPAAARIIDPVPMPTPEPEPTASSTRPAWSEQPFECLLFRVAGLQLAVPLVLLGAIHRMDDKVKPIPGRPPWYMGMLPAGGQNLRVVDTAQWIMAGRVPEGTRDNYRFVIRLDQSEWALACDEVAQSFTLNPGEVRWRSGRSKRPWLAGTVIKHMCALIDVGTMASLLARAEREQRLELD
ncbi:chemotaxis protein CheW [Marinobacter salicampi]|uniref:chemotaxis protein CheW n=1 Tax=Marinobacter salicampi TaxID=435907 RepID=UPI001F5E4CE8|nr:CheW domain-containing protein [Marinobacter salicampi]